MTGRINQPKNIKNPAKIINDSVKIPITIKTERIIAPMILESKFENNTSEKSLKLNPLSLDQVYLRQGEKNVFKREIVEK